MSDNVNLAALAGTCRTDDVGGVQYQVMKLDGGGDGLTVPIIAGQQVAALSIPVVIASDQGALTVAGHAVTNAGTFAVQATGTFWQATQPVSGTFWQATQPVSIATAPVLVAGSALIGKVGIDQTTPGTTNATRDDKGNRIISVAGSTLTRPANTTPYSINDSISDNATAGSVTANTVAISDTNNFPVAVACVELHSTDTGFGGVNIRLWAYNSDPTASSGVVGGDNAAFSNKKAGFVGTLSGTMRTFSDGSRGVLTPDEASPLLTLPGSGVTTLWWQLQTLAAATSSANSTTFIPTFKGYQGVP